MHTRSRAAAATVWLLVLALCAAASPAAAADPLPSWNDTQTRRTIVEFVEAVTREGGPDFVPTEERIATFDNDGTLWLEYPIYTQLLFALDRVNELVPQHPEWKTQQPFQAVLAGDMQAVAASGMKGLMEIVLATHSGTTTTEFGEEASHWLATARQPRFERPYTELVYQPQLELLDYLRANGFKTFIVSGGGVAFMRPWTERVYGIPPEQVVGSSVVVEYEVRDGQRVLVRKPEISFIDDKAGKPVAIDLHIGRRPILAFGNSDGDLQMVEYTTAGDGRRLGLFLHHTDAEREYAYDREGHVGRLDEALDRAAAEGWVVVDMKRSWKQVFPSRNPASEASSATGSRSR